MATATKKMPPPPPPPRPEEVVLRLSLKEATALLSVAAMLRYEESPEMYSIYNALVEADIRTARCVIGLAESIRMPITGDDLFKL